MTILVTGGSGSIGSALVMRLAASGASIRVLVRSPDKCRFPAGVEVVKGDLTDIDSIRSALAGVRTLFLLNAVCPDELNQAMMTLNLAHSAGIERIVYLSVTRSDVFSNVPHFAAKHACERMIEEFDISATILRPNYFIQNDVILEAAIMQDGVYPMPIGGIGLSMIDTRDIADVAAHEVVRRDQAAAPLERTIIELSGPDVIDGASAARMWSENIGRPVHYGGDDLANWEQVIRGYMPQWMAYDICLMLDRFQRAGLAASTEDKSRLETILGRPLRRYSDFVAETSKAWLSSTAQSSV